MARSTTAGSSIPPNPQLENVVSVVADERALGSLAEHRIGTERRQAPLAEREPERNDLDRKRAAHAETLDDLLGADDDDQPLRRGGNDLFAHERAAEALDEVETRIDLICAIDREIEFAGFGEQGEGKDPASPRVDGSPRRSARRSPSTLGAPDQPAQ